MSKLIEIVADDIQLTIQKLKEKKFKVDPIGGPQFSRVTSVMSSAYKRHGLILEKAVLQRLKQCTHLEVWEEKNFHVSKRADHMVVSTLDAPQTFVFDQIRYSEKSKDSRVIQIDVVVYDDRRKRLSAYEVKRGNGAHDASKKRSMLRDLLCTQVLLGSYGRYKGFKKLQVASSHIIFYYGECSINLPHYTLKKEDLDDHFNFSVIKEVEEVNNYFRQKLNELLMDWPKRI